MSSTPWGSVNPLLPPGKAHLIPVEILSEIFLLVLLDGSSRDKETLELVCQRWYATMISTPGITSRLWIRRATKKEAVQAFIQRRETRFAVIVDVNHEGDGEDFNSEDFHTSFIVACQAAPRWTFLNLLSFPPPGEYTPDTTMKPLESLRGFIMGEHCDLGSFLEPLMTAITTTSLPRLTKLALSDSRAVLYLVQPTCLHYFCSLTTLTIKLSRKMEGPADVLPHLRRLETFHAKHLHIPIYPPDASLPLIQTLSWLTLKCVSVQWMAGKVFPALRRCSITFPRHIDAIRVQPVTMLACTGLAFNSNDLDPLRHFHHSPLTRLQVACGQWNVRRGNPQFVTICPTIFASAQSLYVLDLEVKCSEQLLVLALRELPALDDLTLRLASPHALSESFFQGFVAPRLDAGNPCEMAALPRLPLCAGLTTLHVYYRRWLRGAERRGLIPVFSDIVSSRKPEDCNLSLRVGWIEEYWFILGPVESISDFLDDDEFSVIGVSSPYGIIPLCWFENPSLRSLTEVPFKEAEYLVARHRLPISCLSTLHNLVELRVGDKQDILPTASPPNLPLFRTLRVLAAENIHPSFLAGKTFHKLERGRMSLQGDSLNLSHAQVAQLPFCTRLDVDDLTLLATLQIPHICELGVSFNHPEFDMIWEKHIAVNVNLSGLKLLHVYGRHQQADLIQALRCLPTLKSLIVGNGSDLDADFFGEFAPMPPNETAAFVQSHNEGQGSEVLCPMLKRLLIEECDLTQRLELAPVFRKVVTLRTACGSPLEEFTLFDFELGRKTELVGSHGSFVMETAVLGEDAEPFGLDI